MKAVYAALLGVVVIALAVMAYQARPRDAAVAEPPARAAEPDRDDEPAATPAAVPRRAVAAEPESPDEAYLEERRERAAAEAARVRAEHVSSPEVDPDQDHTVVVAPMRKARDAFHAGRFEEAIEQLEAALVLDPDKKSARSMLVEAACTIGEEGIARRHVAELDPLRQKLAARRCDQLGVVLPGIDWRDADLP